MADALRYDYLPEIGGESNILKTIPSGLITPVCVSSILTGLYPPQHGVYKFSNPIGGTQTTIFDLVEGSHKTYALDKTFMKNLKTIENTVKQDVWQKWLQTEDEPFVLFKRDLFTHAPYNQEHEGKGEFDTVEAYLSDRMPNVKLIQDEYRKSVDKVCSRFLNDINVLDERNLIEDTLIIFTADHGELLGKYGKVGHGGPQVPEVVYVPTIFFNDRLTVQGESIAHIDLLPTINSLLGESIQIDNRIPGENLTHQVTEQRKVFNINSNQQEYATWNKDGGIVHNNETVKTRLSNSIKYIINNTSSLRQNPVEMLKFTAHRNTSYGQPGFSRQASESFTAQVISNSKEQTHSALGGDSKEQLRALGYTDDQIK